MGVPATISIPAGDYVIFSGDLDISTEIEITGASARTTVLDANGTSRHFDITASGSLTLSGVELFNGAEVSDHGGAIKNAGTLNVSNVLFNSCYVSGSLAGAAYGGAIHNSETAVISNSTFLDCKSTGGDGANGSGGGGGSCGAGGAVAHWFGSDLALTNCTITECWATGGEGGNGSNILSDGGGGAPGVGSFGGGGDGGDYSWNNNDGAPGGMGGGGGGGSESSSWWGGAGDGGNAGLYSGGGSGSSGSSGGGGGGGAGLGGALFLRGGTASLEHCTLIGNGCLGGEGGTSTNGALWGGDGTGRGAGVFVYSCTLTLDHAIIQGNTTDGAGDEDIMIASGTVTSTLGHNLLGDIGTAALSGTTTGNLSGLDPLVSALADNGGQTDTFMPLPCDPISPLIDAGVASTVTEDQRGEARDAMPDIGAVEGPTPVDITIGDTTLCPGATWLVEVAWPDADFTWQDGSTGPTFLAADSGTYTVTVEANGCTEDFSTTVDLIDITPPDFGPDTTICPGDFVVLDAGNPGAIYAWSNATWSQTTMVVDSGEVHVLLQIANCIVSDTIHVAFHEDYPLDLGAGYILCPGSSVDLDATNPDWLALPPDFIWGDGSEGAVATVSAAGDYVVTATTVDGCSVSDAVNVLISSLTTVDLGVDTTICPGLALELDTGYPSAAVVWQDGSTGSTMDVNSTGIYTANVSLDGCFAMDQIFVQVITPFDASLPEVASFCDGDSTLVFGLFGAAEYVWQDGITGNQRWFNIPGLYTLESTYNGCSNFDEVMVTSMPNPVFSFGLDLTLCEGDQAVITPGLAAYDYIVFNDVLAVDSLTVDSVGIYWAEAVFNGCRWSDTIEVAIAEVPVFTLPADTLLCPDGVLEVAVDLEEGILVSWSNGVVSHDLTLYQADQYVATAQIGSCVHRDTIEVGIADPYAINLLSDYDLCQDETLELDMLQSAGVYPTTYIWSNGRFGHKIEVNHGGDYSVVMRNVCDTVEHTVHVKPILCGCQVYVPNAFTPDNDGKNDQFKPVLDCEYDEYTFHVFDRWGRPVFQSNDLNEGWYGQVEGTASGKTKESSLYFAIDGVYLWEVVLKRSPDGFPKIERTHGYVHVLR